MQLERDGLDPRRRRGDTAAELNHDRKAGVMRSDLKSTQRRSFLKRSVATLGAGLIPLSMPNRSRASNPAEGEGDGVLYSRLFVTIPVTTGASPENTSTIGTDTLSWQEVTVFPPPAPLVRVAIKGMISIFNVNTNDVDPVEITDVSYTDLDFQLTYREENRLGIFRRTIDKTYSDSVRVGNVYLHNGDTIVVQQITTGSTERPRRILHRDVSFSLPSRRVPTNTQLPQLSTLPKIGEVVVPTKRDKTEPLIVIYPSMLEHRN